MKVSLYRNSLLDNNLNVIPDCHIKDIEIPSEYKIIKDKNGNEMAEYKDELGNPTVSG